MNVARKGWGIVSALVFGLVCVGVDAPAQTTVRTEPGGKILLVVDGQDIRSEAGGKRLLFVDGDDLRPEPGAERVLFIDGDSVRRKPGDIRLLCLDGSDIRRAPGGARLLFVDGADIRPEPGGDRLWFLDGEALSPAQLFAALYVLKPDLFQLSASEESELREQMAAAAAEEEARASQDPVPGDYDISAFSCSDDSDRKGRVVIAKDGDRYRFDFKHEGMAAWHGIGVKANDEWLLAAIGAQADVRLGVYTIQGGTLSGTWTSGAPGAETLTGAAELGGEYALKSGGAAGTVTVEPQEPTLNYSWPTFTLTWTVGGQKTTGVGVRVDDRLYVACGGQGDFAVIGLKMEGSLAGDFLAHNRTTGFYTLSK